MGKETPPPHPPHHPYSPHQVTPSSTTEMRTKLFPDETAEALDELEYHPHHGHAAGVRGATAGVAPGGSGSGPSSSSSPELASNTEAVVGGGVGASPPPGAGSGSADTNGADGNGAAVGAVGADARKGAGQGGGKNKNSGAADGTGTMIQRMNKTFRPDPLGAYTGDRSTLRFKPRRQEGLTKLKPRQQRTIFDASQISPMLQVRTRDSWFPSTDGSFNVVSFLSQRLRVVARCVVSRSRIILTPCSRVSCMFVRHASVGGGGRVGTTLTPRTRYDLNNHFTVVRTVAAYARFRLLVC